MVSARRPLPLPSGADVPSALLPYANWVAWRAIMRDEKITKVPYSPRTGHLASTTDPRTWSTFDAARSFAERTGCDGLGFVFTESPFCGIDLDHCLDRAVLAPWAAAVVKRLNSYTEVSPSGSGLHILVRGTLPDGGRKRQYAGGAVEVYDQGRYFTFTGRSWQDMPHSVEDRNAVLTEWVVETFPPSPPTTTTVAAQSEERQCGTALVDDAALLTTAMEATDGATFTALWRGDTTAYGGDESAADLALCNLLAFWTDRDAGRMDRLFRQSKLFRPKWDARRGKETYGARTIAKALADATEGYEGPSLAVELNGAASSETGKEESKEPEQGSKPPRVLMISAPELMAKEFEPPRYAVPGLLPEGLCILAGRPKLGKSWLGLGLALAVASGTVALGQIEVEAGEVLHLALEDGERRLQRRIGDLLDEAPVPARLTLAWRWPRIDDGGLTELEIWLAGHPDARLVVVDTFKRIRPPERRNTGIYGQDYDAVAPVADLAQKYAVSIVLVMHTRKADAEDPLDLISGSLGLSGAADGALVMKRQRGQMDALLSVIDRDAEESEKALRWNIATGGWMLLGDAEDYRRSQQRNEVLAALHDLGPMTPKDLADTLEKHRNAIRWLLRAMHQAGQVANLGGTYMALAPRPSVADVPLHTNANTPNRPTGLTPLTPLTGQKG